MAENIILDPMYYATTMVKNDDAHGMVSGAVHTTGDLLKTWSSDIKTAPGISVVSSFFIMILKDKTLWRKWTDAFRRLCCESKSKCGMNWLLLLWPLLNQQKKLMKFEPKVCHAFFLFLWKCEA